MLRIGIAGIGFMGYTHFTAAAGLKGAQVTALFSSNEKKLAGDWRGIQGNFGPPAGQIDTSKLARYRQYEELLADPNVDLVDLCTPPDLHEEMAIQALRAGKHVLVEKPIALQSAAADRMVAAAKASGKFLMVGQVLPFFPEFGYLHRVVQSGEFGRLRAAHFRRVIARPDWSGDMASDEKTGGPAVDLHIHDTHFISLICGVPKAVQSRGIVENGYAQYLSTQYVFDDPALAVSCVSGGIATKALAFTHGFEAYFENATIQYEAGTIAGEWVVSKPLMVLTNDGQRTAPTLEAGSEWCAAFTVELQTAVDAIVSGRENRLLSGELARDALKLTQLETKSAATGQTVAVA